LPKINEGLETFMDELEDDKLALEIEAKAEKPLGKSEKLFNRTCLR